MFFTTSKTARSAPSENAVTRMVGKLSWHLLLNLFYGAHKICKNMYLKKKVKSLVKSFTAKASFDYFSVRKKLGGLYRFTSYWLWERVVYECFCSQSVHAVQHLWQALRFITHRPSFTYNGVPDCKVNSIFKQHFGCNALFLVFSLKKGFWKL